jgi:hypothetical protein
LQAERSDFAPPCVNDAPTSTDNCSMASNRLPEERRVAGLLGLAFDADDGHKRITRGTNFLLAGGSEETHLFMRETILKVNQRLDERGQRLADVSVDELRNLIDEVQD